jgi:hypothetical protein
MVKKGKIKINDNNNNNKMIYIKLFIGIRNGLTQESMHYAKANNYKTPDYKPSKAMWWIITKILKMSKFKIMASSTEEDEIAKAIGNVIQNKFKMAFQLNNSKMLTVLKVGRTYEFISFFCVLPEEEYRWLTMTQGGVYTTDAITTD